MVRLQSFSNINVNVTYDVIRYGFVCTYSNIASIDTLVRKYSKLCRQEDILYELYSL